MVRSGEIHRTDILAYSADAILLLGHANLCYQRISSVPSNSVIEFVVYSAF